jgi:DHA1 family bicyclomycin/chloramphenicol resistance-like MFS transporter
VVQHSRPSPARRVPGRLLLLLLLGTLTGLATLTLDMYLPAFPQMSADFGVSQVEIQLSLTSCLIGLALGQLVTGPVSDRWGRRGPALVGLLAYIAATLLCVIAPSATTLTMLRLIQGFTGGMGSVIARSIVRDLYSGVAAAKFFSRLTLVFGVAPIAAPTIGSLVLRTGSWRMIFVALAAIGALLAVLVAWRLLETLPRAARSAGGAQQTLRAIRTVLADRVFLGYSLTQGFAFAGLFTYIAESSFVFQEVFGLSDTTYSLLFGLNSVGLITLSQLNVRLLDRFAPRQLLNATLLAGAVATAVLMLGAVLDSLPLVVVALLAYVTTIGMVNPNGTTLALDRHGTSVGTAAALMGALQSAIAALGAPLAGGLGPNGNAVPMAAVMCGCALLSLLSLHLLARDRRASGTAARPAPTPVTTA